MKLNKRLTFLVVIGLIVLAVVGIWHFSGKPETVTPIPSSGGALIDITPQDNGAYFLQNDSRWANDPLGGSGESFSSVGCTICSIAMAASCLGYEITPKVLNSRLTQNNGYTSRGWVIWAKITDATQGRISVRVPSRLTHSDIDQALQAGSIPVVKFFLPGGIPHWVAVVAKNGKEYLIKDPLLSSKKVIKLSGRTRFIAAVRYVEKR
jgi:hypothetical protein